MKSKFNLDVSDRLFKSIRHLLPEDDRSARIALKIALLKSRSTESWATRLFNKISN